MSLSPYFVAVQGIGATPLLVAVQGLLDAFDLEEGGAGSSDTRRRVVLDEYEYEYKSPPKKPKQAVKTPPGAPIDARQVPAPQLDPELSEGLAAEAAQEVARVIDRARRAGEDERAARSARAAELAAVLSTMKSSALMDEIERKRNNRLRAAILVTILLLQ